MVVRPLNLIWTIIALLPSATFAQVQPELKLGDIVSVELKGDLARAFVNRTKNQQAPDQATLTIPCMVVKSPSPGHTRSITLEHALTTGCRYRALRFELNRRLVSSETEGRFSSFGSSYFATLSGDLEKIGGEYYRPAIYISHDDLGLRPVLAIGRFRTSRDTEATIKLIREVVNTNLPKLRQAVSDSVRQLWSQM